MNKRTWLIMLTGVFCGSLVTANVLAGKLISIGDLVAPAAVLVFCVTFLITDVIGEIYGKQTANTVVWVGFTCNLLFLLFVEIGKLVPPAPIWHNQEAYIAILGSTPRVVLASMLAYLVSQSHDVWSFHFWREKTRGKHLWLRNNISTITSQCFDTIIFITVAFGGTLPWDIIGTMIISQYAIKLIIAIIDTPLCYMLVKWIRNSETMYSEGCTK